MNNLISITDPLVITRSSREIAELVDSRHDKVKQSILTTIQVWSVASFIAI